MTGESRKRSRERSACRASDLPEQRNTSAHYSGREIRQLLGAAPIRLRAVAGAEVQLVLDDFGSDRSPGCGCEIPLGLAGPVLSLRRR